MNRKIYYWKLRTTELQLGERTLVMGVLNLTPDSFSDGGRFSDPDQAYARALELEEQGADIIDIGAESTRPESKRISADEEWQRLVPVLKRLKGKLRVPLSLDTYKSETAERALEYGVEILNDPSGLTFDADLAKVAVAGNAGLILNHMRGLPETWGKQSPMPEVMGNITKDLEATASRARRMGVEKNRIMVDPGIGFGKRKEQNSEILAHLAKLASLDLPILVGPSRKSFLMQTTESEMLHATAAAVAVAILNGAHIVRVHDVREMRIVAQIADEIVRAGAAADRPSQEAAERQAAKTPRKELTPFMAEERHVPTRPPLARPAAPAPVVPISEPSESERETQETPKRDAPPPKRFAPAANQRVEDRPIVRRPPQDRPSKGWESERPKRSGPPSDRPSYGGGGRPPFRGNQDRPERPAAGGRSEGRPPFRDSGGRPPFRGGQDRPSYGGGGGKPPFRGKSDRPGSGGGQDRPSFGGGSGRPPYRGGSDRPSFGGAAGRPPRGDSNDRPPRGPSKGRPPQGGAPRRPFRKRP